MKKIYLFLQIIALLFVTFGCSCFNGDKIPVEVSQTDVSEYVELNMVELKEKIENKDSFVLYVFKTKCPACNRFKGIINSVIDENDILIYAIQYTNIESDHELKELMYTPSIVIYDEGEYTFYTDPVEDEKYFEDDEGFVKFLDKYTYMVSNEEK